MPKIAYIEKKFQAKTQLIIHQANQIIEEYQAEDMKLTVRQLYYQFVATGEDNMEMLGFPLVKGTHNNPKSYAKLIGVVSDARLAGLIDWDAIEDRTRNLEELGHWQNPGHIIRSVSYWFRVDHWEGQPYRPQVWIEKEALVGVIADICEQLDIGYYACKGYMSLSEMWVGSERFGDIEADGQQPVIIHLGDHDPSGMDMTRDIGDRQNTFLRDVEIKRIALNMDQIKQYNPPPNPTKLKDSRAPKYVSEFGYDSWELDALEPRAIRDLIEQTALSYRDDEIYNEVLDREREYKRILKNIEENWETL
ncbi:hypothetical protein LCGC14_0845470 [marine sediment metagenome]|uniref:Uncharacterized protein n=1 Tax=marine sediment metagenome TaxID=412755 RepID=A0A0F9RWL1_9ZZZZ